MKKNLKTQSRRKNKLPLNGMPLSGVRLLWVQKVVNFVSVDILFFQLKWNVSVSECFGVPFQGCTVIYIYSTNIIQIQDKLIINYAI